VVGDVTPTIGLDHLTARRADLLLVDEEMIAWRATTACDRVGMFEQQQAVVGSDNQGALKGEGVAVRDPAEPTDTKGPIGARSVGQRTSASQSRVSMISLTRCMNAAA
jgi:hypothetical protein